MRTYWVPTYADGTPVAGARLHRSQALAMADLHGNATEVAVVPAAALKRLVEAVEKAHSELDQALEHDYFIMSEEAYFALQSALSEWKGGAE